MREGEYLKQSLREAVEKGGQHMLHLHLTDEKQGVTFLVLHGRGDLNDGSLMIIGNLVPQDTDLVAQVSAIDRAQAVIEFDQENIEGSIRSAMSSAQTGDVIRQQAETIDEMLQEMNKFIKDSDLNADI